jgi:coiled-coil domain-containing protein 39
VGDTFSGWSMEFSTSGLRGTDRVVALPAFANATNASLDAGNRELEAQIFAAQEALDDNDGRAKTLSQHLDKVRAELTYTQSKLNVRRQDLDTEKRSHALGRQEMVRAPPVESNVSWSNQFFPRNVLPTFSQQERWQKDKTCHQKQLEALREQLNSVQSQLFADTERLDQFKLLMNWNSEELSLWARAAQQKDEDTLAMERCGLSSTAITQRQPAIPAACARTKERVAWHCPGSGDKMKRGSRG